MDENLTLEGVGPTLQSVDGDAIHPAILERIAVRLDESKLPALLSAELDEGELPALLPAELELQSESFATDRFQWMNKVDVVQVQSFLNAHYDEYDTFRPSTTPESNRLCRARWTRISYYELLAEYKAANWNAQLTTDEEGDVCEENFLVSHGR